MSEPRRHAGYYGKVPTHGDFVTNYLDRGFVTRLDTWLQASIRESQTQLGKDWLDAFLVTPVWRVSFPTGIWGRQPMIAVMIPSVDRVGRYFPLVLASTLPQPKLTTKRLRSAHSWFDRAEDLARSILSPNFSLPDFDESMLDLIPPETYNIMDEFPFEPNEDPNAVHWWTKDSFRQPRVTSGLPEPDRFTDLIMAPLEHVEPAAQPIETPPEPEPPPPPPLDVMFGASSTKGAISVTNSDGWIVTEGHQLAAVIGGQGNQPANAAAAKTIAEILNTVDGSFSMNDLVADTKGKIGHAHSLLRAQEMPGRAAMTCSIAILLIQGQRYSVLWAGNVRAYLLRDDALHMLTRDHINPSLPNVLTRSMGSATQLTLDSAIGQVRAGDRFLLCSAGVHGPLSDAELLETLINEPSVDKTATVLTQDAVISGGSLDATALALFLAEKNAAVEND